MRVITAAELDAMTPAERDAAFDASVVRDLSQLPPAYVARLQARVLARIQATETGQDTPRSRTA